MPLVSVVLIGYNDVANLPTAIRSAQRQTLRDLEIVVVDDASTDGSADVAEQFARADPRVRVIRLDRNSGGCSRPRNAGIEATSGRYLMFLDSDDELPRRAAARLVDAAERTKADLACGRYVRRHHHPRRLLTANDDLYLRSTYVASIADRPRQLYDTPAWNKLYRRSLIENNGLRFPEGLLYEDLLFTTEAYCAAAGIAVIPDVVYVWHVRRQAPALSITTRGGVRNWRDRFEVHRRIDEFLSGHHVGRELVEAKQRKFLDVDLTLFLRELRKSPASDRPEWLEVARAYLAPLDPDELPFSDQRVRAAVEAIRRSDLEATLAAADRVTTGGVRFARVTRVRVEGSAVTVDGAVGAADEADSATAVIGRPHTATLELRSRLGGLLATVPVTVDAGPELRFRATFDLATLGSRLVSPRTGPEVRFILVVRHDGGSTRLPLTARDADLPEADVVVTTRWRPLTGDRIRFQESNGRFVAQVAAPPAGFDQAVYLATRARNTAVRAKARWAPRISR